MAARESRVTARTHSIAVGKFCEEKITQRAKAPLQVLKPAAWKAFSPLLFRRNGLDGEADLIWIWSIFLRADKRSSSKLSSLRRRFFLSPATDFSRLFSCPLGREPGGKAKQLAVIHRNPKCYVSTARGYCGSFGSLYFPSNNWFKIECIKNNFRRLLEPREPRQ